MNEEKNVISNVILEQRKKVSVSGVLDMDSFSETLLALNTHLGFMEIKGKNFHLNKLNLDMGEVVLDGEIDDIVYQNSNKRQEKSSFFTKIFGS